MPDAPDADIVAVDPQAQLGLRRVRAFLDHVAKSFQERAADLASR